MNNIEEIKTRYGVYYVVPIAVTRELLDMKDERLKAQYERKDLLS